MALLQAPSQQDLQLEPPDQTAPPDNSAAYMALLQQIQQGAQEQPGSSPLPQPPSVMDSPQAQMLRQRSQETEADMMAKLRRQYFGLKDGQENPTTGTRLKMGAGEVLRALVLGGYRTPQARMQSIVDKQFPADTRRLEVGEGMLHNEATMQTAQAKMAQMQQEIDERRRHQLATEQATQSKNASLEVYRNKIASIRQQMANTGSDLNAQKLLNLQQDALLKQWKIDNPSMDEHQVIAEFVKGQTDTNVITNIISSVQKAYHPQITTGSTGGVYADENGLRYNYNNKNFLGQQQAPPLNIGPVGPMGTSAPSALPAQGAPPLPNGVPAQPAQPASPQGPVAQGPGPGQGGVNPAAILAQAAPAQRRPPVQNAPVPSSAPKMAPMDLLEPDNPLPPGRYPPELTAKRDAITKDRVVGAKKIDEYEYTANSGLANMTNAILTGKAKQFQGVVAGNPFFQYFRQVFGTKSEDESLALLQNLDALYGKLGANIRGRFTVPEIAGHLQAMASPSATPENAVMALAALKLQANMQQMFVRGKLKASDAPMVTQLVHNELTRIQNNLKGASTTDKALALHGKTPDRFNIKSIETLMQERQTASQQHALPIGGPTWEAVQARAAQLEAEEAAKAGKK